MLIENQGEISLNPKICNLKNQNTIVNHQEGKIFEFSGFIIKTIKLVIFIKLYLFIELST